MSQKKKATLDSEKKLRETRFYGLRSKLKIESYRIEEHAIVDQIIIVA